MPSDVSVVILAAGKGTRMRSPLPKVLHPLCGRPLVAWVVDQALALDPARVVLVVGHGAEAVEAAVRSQVEGAGGVEFTAVRQEPQNGTGHALQVCIPALAGAGRVVVLYGDMPLMRPTSLTALLEAQSQVGAGGAALLTAWPDEARGFGRILRDGDEDFVGIVEQKDCSEEELAIGEVNLGVYAFPGAALLDALPRLSNDNAQGEYYLTDVLGMLVAAENPVATVELEDADEGLGINTIEQLSDARWALQMRIHEEHMANGVYIEDPSSTYIDHGVTIGTGTHVLPCTVIRSGVTIGEGCEVGPFTHLRVGTVLKNGAEVGNFTECKQSTVGEGSKAKHLSYLGDAQIGARTNIGAGTIFANYDGVHKHKTTVGDGAFVGSGTILVGPNNIPDGATTGAGAVVTRSADVGPNETWVGMPARRHQKKSAPEGAE
jgi:bifunctional UDP-N-acetylglucosamine pyrophosphorylase / glucosamine-1-phosphate N-acetyltransferase